MNRPRVFHKCGVAIGACLLVTALADTPRSEETPKSLHATSSSILPNEPIFVRVRHVQTDTPGSASEIPIVATLAKDGAHGAGQFAYYELSRFKFSGDSFERWFVVVPAGLRPNQKIALTFIESPDEQPDTVLTVREPEIRDTDALTLFVDAHGLRLLIECLNRDQSTMTAADRGRLLALTSSFPNTVAARYAHLILACNDFRQIEGVFNNDGPPGCFGACFAAFEEVAKGRIADPITLEAWRRLAIAKAWSSDYQAAAELFATIRTTNIARQISLEAERGLEELGRLQEMRNGDAARDN